MQLVQKADSSKTLMIHLQALQVQKGTMLLVPMLICCLHLVMYLTSYCVLVC